MHTHLMHAAGTTPEEVINDMETIYRAALESEYYSLLSPARKANLYDSLSLIRTILNE